MAVASPLLLRSLGTGLLSIRPLMSPEAELSLLTSPLKVEASLCGVAQDPTAHETPVKLLSEKPFRSHLRHGLPVLSRARKPALIAPVLAFGPSLWPLAGVGPAGPFFVGSVVRSMVPSALLNVLVYASS